MGRMQKRSFESLYVVGWRFHKGASCFVETIPVVTFLSFDDALVGS